MEQQCRQECSASKQSNNFASVTDLKEFKLHTVYAVISEVIKDLHLVGQAAEFNSVSKFEPLQVIWQSLQGLSQKVIKSLEGKLISQALGAALRQMGKHKHRAFFSRQQSLLAHLTKTCYYSCYIYSVQESKRFQCFVNFG